jgi:glycopeptide antibiotics resistance protein
MKTLLYYLGGDYLSYLPFGFFVLLPIFLIIYIALRQLNNPGLKRRLFNGVMLGYLLILSYLIWFRGLGDARDALQINLEPFETIKLYLRAYRQETLSFEIIIVNLVGNVVMMFPLGFWLYVKPYGWFRKLLFIVLVPVLFEGGQYLLHQLHMVSRSVDIDDWILNSLGIYLGLLLNMGHEQLLSKLLHQTKYKETKKSNQHIS